MGKYRIMERILEFTDSKTIGKLGFSDRRTPVNVSKCHVLRKFTARFLQGKRHLFCREKRYDILTCEDIDDFSDIRFVS